MSDDCEMCDGAGEIDVPKLDEYGNVPCPDCISREHAERVGSMTAENKQLRTDIEHLLAIMDHVIEATGEALDPDDACMVAQIRASPGRTGTDAAMMAGFDAINV